MRFFRARSLILSPSKTSIARHTLPPRPALKSLSGSGRLAPWAKVSFTLSLWALPTAIIPSRDHTGLPIHFHSSDISRSASRMLLRILASASPRQSLSFAISWSIFFDGFMGFFLTFGEALCDHFVLFFCANNRAFAEPHAAEEAILQHELMVERGCDMGRDQNGQQRCKSRMDLERGEHGESVGQGFAIALEHAADEPSGGPSAGDHQKHDH